MEKSDEMKKLEGFIETSIEPIEEAFTAVLTKVHEHGALEEREATVAMFREMAEDVPEKHRGLASIIEAGDHRKGDDAGDCG